MKKSQKGTTATRSLSTSLRDRQKHCYGRALPIFTSHCADSNLTAVVHQLPARLCFERTWVCTYGDNLYASIRDRVRIVGLRPICLLFRFWRIRSTAEANLWQTLAVDKAMTMFSRLMPSYSRGKRRGRPSCSRLSRFHFNLTAQFCADPTAGVDSNSEDEVKPALHVFATDKLDVLQ